MKSMHLLPGHPIISFYYFPRGRGNESSNLIGSLRVPDFPICAHGHGNAYMSVCPFVYSLFEAI